MMASRTLSLSHVSVKTKTQQSLDSIGVGCSPVYFPESMMDRRAGLLGLASTLLWTSAHCDVSFPGPQHRTTVCQGLEAWALQQAKHAQLLQIILYFYVYNNSICIFCAVNVAYRSLLLACLLAWHPCDGSLYCNIQFGSLNSTVRFIISIFNSQQFWQ